MKDYEELQPLIHWPGDVRSLISEMKRRAGVETDTELATALGRTQGAVSHWRKKGTVPPSVLLSFDETVKRVGSDRTAIAMAARVVAIRLAEFMFEEEKERNAEASRWLTHTLVASSFHSLTDAAHATLRGRVGEGSPFELLHTLLEDRAYLSALSRFARQLPLSLSLEREQLSPPSVMEVPQSVPQSVKTKRSK